MKKFKFKLHALLKLREFKEQKIKIELGVIVSKLEQLKDRRIIINKEIGDAYKSQEQFNQKTIDGAMVQFFSYFIDGKRREIEVLNAHIAEEDIKYNVKVTELRLAMGEVKVLENIQKKELKEYKREVNKGLQKDLDENVMMRQNRHP